MKDYEKAALAIGAVAVGAAALSFLAKPTAASLSPRLFFHIKNDPVNGPVTVGKAAQVYGAIVAAAARSGLTVGLEPECVASWADQLSYLREFAKIPVMLNVWTSDNSYSISTSQIAQAMAVCPVKYLRFHEVMSYYASTINTQAVQSYIQSVLAFSKASKIPLFWNEWDPTTYPAIANIIRGYEDNVLVSFGTNNTQVAAGLQALQIFKRKAFSVQAWYWTQNYLQMPPSMEAQFTLEAFNAGCEIVQYEPYSYFFDSNANPRVSLSAMFASL